jgi:hypothetical protein
MRLILREQKIGGHVVIPILEDDADRWRVTVVIQVGTSNDLALRQISSDSVSAELTAATGNKFELFVRPPAGELPIQGSRSLQSVAVFVFGILRNRPKWLNVRIEGDTATFDVDRLRDTLPGFTDPPPPGGTFPARPPPANVVERILRAILDFLKGIGHFLKNIFDSDKCCVESFNAPASRTPDAGGKREVIRVSAVFHERATDCKCECCQYRQFVRGQFTNIASGNPVPFMLPDGPFDPNEYREDCVIDEFGPGKHGCYGHRETSVAGGGDTYSHVCRYDAGDGVRCGATQRLHAEFLGMIVDVCQGKIVSINSWVVDL